MHLTAFIALRFSNTIVMTPLVDRKHEGMPVEPTSTQYLVKAKMKTEVRIPSESLKLGMYVSKLDRPWTEVPVLLQGFSLISQSDIDILQAHCQYVYIETDDPQWIEYKEELSTRKFKAFEEKKSIHEEIPEARATLQKTHVHVEKVLNDVNNGETFDLEESRQAVRQCVDSIARNANAMLWLSMIKNEDQYTSEHCMRVGILAIAFGRFMGMSEQDQELLGLCGLLHDVGKIKIPNEILNKPGRLTQEEYRVMREHVSLGEMVLGEIDGLDPLIIQTALHHHERADQKGYPDNLDASLLHQFIRMVAIVDVYDAITSNRCYQEGRTPFEALRILFNEAEKHFDKDLVEVFIKMIGIYPPGTLIEMANGELGIVISSNPLSRLKPKVELVTDRHKKLRPPYVIDMSKNPTDSNGTAYVIERGLANGAYGIDIKDYLFRDSDLSA